MSNSEMVTILSDRQKVSKLVEEAKKELDRLNGMIKEFMGDSTELYLSEYHVIYREQKKMVADTDKMKKAGIYDEYSKPQVTRPLYVK